MKRWLSALLALAACSPVAVSAQPTVEEAFSAMVGHVYEAKFLEGQLAFELDLAFDGATEAIQGEVVSSVQMQREPFFAIRLSPTFEGQTFLNPADVAATDFAGALDLLVSHGQFFYRYDLKAPEVAVMDWELLDWGLPVFQQWTSDPPETDDLVADIIESQLYDLLEQQLTLSEAADGEGYQMAVQLFETDEEAEAFFNLLDQGTDDTGMMSLVDGRFLFMVLQLLQLSDFEVTVTIELTEDFFPSRMVVDIADGLTDEDVAEVAEASAESGDYAMGMPSILGDATLTFDLSVPQESPLEIPEVLLDRYSSLDYEESYQALKELMDLALEGQEESGMAVATLDELFGSPLADNGYSRFYSSLFQDFAFDLTVMGSGVADADMDVDPNAADANQASVTDFVAYLYDRSNKSTVRLPNEERMAMLQAAYTEPETLPTFEEVDAAYQDYRLMGSPMDLSYSQGNESFIYDWATKELKGYGVLSNERMNWFELDMTEQEIEALLQDEDTTLEDLFETLGDHWQAGVTLNAASDEPDYHFSWQYYDGQPAGMVTVTTDEAFTILDYSLFGIPQD